MIRKTGLWLLWIGFIAYGVLFAPSIQADLATLSQWLSGNWPSIADINPLIIALFSLIGMWIFIYSSVLFADGKMQPIAAWPFILASVAMGVIGLIPYLALREAKPYFSGQKDILLQIVDSRRTGVLITLSTLVFLAFGLIWGNWIDFAVQWQTSRFIHLMSLAFCLFALLFPTVLGDDMARRGIQSPLLFWAVAIAPLLGPLAYWCWRPPLANTISSNSQERKQKVGSY